MPSMNKMDGHKLSLPKTYHTWNPNLWSFLHAKHKKEWLRIGHLSSDCSSLSFLRLLRSSWATSDASMTAWRSAKSLPPSASRSAASPAFVSMVADDKWSFQQSTIAGAAGNQWLIVTSTVQFFSFSCFFLFDLFNVEGDDDEDAFIYHFHLYGFWVSRWKQGWSTWDGQPRLPSSNPQEYLPT